MSRSRNDVSAAELWCKWLPAVEGLVPVPAEHRAPVLDRAAAARELGCDDDFLDLLVSSGFPAEDTPDGPRFDYYDVMNLGLRSGTGRSVAELGERQCMRLAAGKPDDWLAQRSWQVTLVASCAAPWCPGAPPQPFPPAPGLLGGELHEWNRNPDDPGTGVARVTTRGAVDEPRTAAVRDIYDELLDALDKGTYEYGWLPGALRADTEVALANRMLDCVVAARLMRDRAQHAGFPARTRKGFLLGLVGVQHAWTEVLEEGRWLPLDPVLAFLARRHPTSHSQFADFCRGSAHNRLLAWDGTADDPFADHACFSGWWSEFGVRPVPIAQSASLGKEPAREPFLADSHGYAPLGSAGCCPNQTRGDN